MRYRKRLAGLQTVCTCGKPYSNYHSQICKVGGFIHMRHDSVKRLFASEAKKCFRDVELEPNLQPLSGEVLNYKSANVKPDARSDVRVRGFWTNQQIRFSTQGYKSLHRKTHSVDLSKNPTLWGGRSIFFFPHPKTYFFRQKKCVYVTQNVCMSHIATYTHATPSVPLQNVQP